MPPLPKWVPESVAIRAVGYYGGRLKLALEDLMASSKLPRNRTKSTQSSMLSLDSLEEGTFAVSVNLNETDWEERMVSQMSKLREAHSLTLVSSFQ